MDRSLHGVMDMAIGHRFARWGGARLSRRFARSIPFLGAAIGAATVAATMRRKGAIGGLLDTGLNAIPAIGVLKIIVEYTRGRDLFPDKGTLPSRR